MPSTMPPLAACFLVQFDNRKGYTLAWHRGSEDLKLEGTIEFKCLPSGLHNVQEDLVYFMHEGLTGVAAFLSTDASEAERNARFLSVGVLASGDDVWTYSSELRDFAKEASTDNDVTPKLEQFWKDHSYSKQSEALRETVLQRNHELSYSANSMLKCFGPLLFPIYKACLLRQRILLIGQPPMLPLCDFVNLLSSISILPDSINTPTSIRQLAPLYTVGVHDIPTLTSTTSWSGISSLASTTSQQAGYIACTSDSLLATKPQLSDVRLALPLPSDLPTAHTWPTLTRTNPANAKESIPMKATQRDLTRWALLTQHLAKRSTSPTPSTPTSEHSDDENDRALLLPSSDDSPTPPTAFNNPQNTGPVIEPQTWSSSLSRFSATTTLLAEAAHDNDETCLLTAANAADALEDANDVPQSANILKCFFRQQTKDLFQVLGARLSPDFGADGQEDEGYRDDLLSDDDERAPLHPATTDSRRQDQGEEVVTISKRDMIDMGLDVYSASDAAFIIEMAKLYFGRKVEVEGAGVEVCGVRIY